MASKLTVRLFEVDPDLGCFLSREDFEEARRIGFRAHVVSRGPVEVSELLRGADAFAAVIVDGMLMEGVQIGGHSAQRLLAPGDLISPAGSDEIWARPSLTTISSWQAAATTRLALLGRETLLAVRRWPELLTGIHARMTEQSHRLWAQLVICQLPRVDQRLLAMMWLLADSWGRVTSIGTTVPLGLTHDTLGALIGARRPTVTLALRALLERGALIRQDRGWLLVEPPPDPAGLPVTLELPQVLGEDASAWRQGPPRGGGDPAPDAFGELRLAIGRLREQHARSCEEFQERLRRIARERERARATRTRMRPRIDARRPAGEAASGNPIRRRTTESPPPAP